MIREWMINYRTGVAVGGIVVLEVAILIVAITTFQRVNHARESVFTDHSQILMDAQALPETSAAGFADARGFLLSRYGSSLETARHGPIESSGLGERLKGAVQTEDTRRFVQVIERAEVEYEAAVKAVVALSRTNAELEMLARALGAELTPERGRTAQWGRESREPDRDVLDEDLAASNVLASSAVAPKRGEDR